MRHLPAALLAGACLLPAATHASGFQIRENSAAMQATSFAGAGSSGRDLSVVFNNPAAMTLLTRSGAQAVVSLVLPESDFSGAGSDALGRLATGGGGEAGDPIPVPAAYLAYAPQGQPWRLGLSVTAPYGLETEYEGDWLGRYSAITSRLETINLNLAGAYELQAGLSLGGGVSLQRAEAKLTNAVDFGALLAGLRVPGFLPQAADGFAAVEGDDWAFGLNLCLLYEPMAGTRVGLTWRSEIEHTLKGDARFEAPAPVRAVLTAANVQAFQPEAGARADLTTPQTVDLSASQELGALTLHGTAAWTDWSTFEEIRVRFDNPAQPDAVDRQEWEDTWFFAMGAEYALDTDWTLRAGVAYDQTPTNDQFRTPRIADGDRTWLSLGAGWEPLAGLAVDVAYSHLFVDDARIDVASGLGNQVAGTFENKADILSVQLRYAF